MKTEINNIWIGREESYGGNGFMADKIIIFNPDPIEDNYYLCWVDNGDFKLPLGYYPI